MAHIVEVEWWNDERGEYHPLDLSNIKVNSEHAVISGRFRILVDREVVYQSWEGEEETST